MSEPKIEMDREAVKKQMAKFLAIYGRSAYADLVDEAFMLGLEYEKELKEWKRKKTETEGK